MEASDSKVRASNVDEAGEVDGGQVRRMGAQQGRRGWVRRMRAGEVDWASEVDAGW
jgi:hypothetical protein